MITLLAWTLIGATIFLSTFYLNIYWNQQEEEVEIEELDETPSLSILMPAYNEEDLIEESIESTLELDYPDFELIVIDDGSTDSTLEKVKKYEDGENVKVVEMEENGGKAAALNEGIKHSDSKYIAVQDADSRLEDALAERAIAKIESDPGLGAVIGSIRSFEHASFIQRLQRIQYRLTNFYRSLMAQIDTLDVTPGAFSVYRKADVEDVGGFDVGNPTEDLEMAWKLREKGKSIDMVFGDYSSTHYPQSFKGLYNQRVRWKRGSIVNSIRYRHMFLDSSYGWFGKLQLPIHVMTPLLAAVSLAMVAVGIGEQIYGGLISISAVGFTLPTLEFGLVRTLLNMQMKIYLPLVVALGVSAYVIKQAYGKAGEEVRHPGALAVYYLGYFALEAVFVVAAILKELFRTKRIWN